MASSPSAGSTVGGEFIGTHTTTTTVPEVFTAALFQEPTTSDTISRSEHRQTRQVSCEKCADRSWRDSQNPALFAALWLASQADQSPGAVEAIAAHGERDLPGSWETGIMPTWRFWYVPATV
jgi:hypothetical protein